MGTRHLIAVQLDGQYRIAQYAQWDGYPEHAGVIVLEFLEKWDRPTFEAKLRAAEWASNAYLDALNDRVKQDGIKDWGKVWPELHRDTGAKILELVQNHDAEIKLRDGIGFAANSLMCEWGYVLDLDANTFEVFKGFNREPVEESERFAGFELKYPDEHTEGYYPIRKVASYSLDDLPDAKLLEGDCYPNDEEEEDEE